MIGAADPPASGQGEPAERLHAVAPQASKFVFVDVTGYNSKHDYVLGGVASPGKIPVTGNETVLDALQYAGGVVASGDSREPGGEVTLVRPGREGGPPRTYPLDLPGIVERGETGTNYQIFPGDRLFVGRKQAPGVEDAEPE